MIHLQGVSKIYDTPAGPFTALAGIDLVVAQGELIAIMGRSGSGKSTLLNLLGALDRPTAGEIRIAGSDIAAVPERSLGRWRGAHVGIVFQFFQLMPTLTALENVMLPMDFSGRWPARDRRRRASELLSRVGLATFAGKLPSTLSGGQQQRVAIARALANAPPLLLADEPTGNLDSETASDIVALFREVSSEGTTVVIATHELEIGRTATRVLRLSDGRFSGTAA